MADVRSMAEFRSLFPSNGFRSALNEYYDWKILKNPFKQGLVMLERDQRGMVIGSGTLTPKNALIGGKEMIIGEKGDAFTHPDYRRQGISSKIFSSLRDTAISQGMDVIFAIPNSQSLPMSTNKLGDLPCPFLNWKLLTKRLLRFPGLAKHMVRQIVQKKFGSADMKMLRRSFSRRNRIKSYESFDLAIVDSISKEIDGIWGSPRYVFFNIRDRTYLNWRYFQNPDEYKVIVAENGSKYLGYVVTKNSKDGKIGMICDFITIDDRLDVFHALIEKAEKILKKTGVQMIQLRCVDNSPYYNALVDQGYYDHDTASRQHIILFGGTDCGKMLLETDGKWHFTLSDTDRV
jgi:GNAT superfamily N-acetyltransferase